MGNKIWKRSNLVKTVNYLKKNGVRHAYYAARERLEEERKTDYFYLEPSAAALQAQREETAGYPYLFSIVVPAYETKESFLREMIDSVCRQSYAGWELIIVDAGSSDTVERIVRAAALRDEEERTKSRIIYRKAEHNRGISGNTNIGIQEARGEYIALLDHDDCLAPDALYHMAQTVRKAQDNKITPVLIYTDEDKFEGEAAMSVDGRADLYSYVSPHYKMEFNLDLILSNNYICHFMAVEADLMKNLQLRSEYDGAQDYDLVLRVVGELYERMSVCALSERIVHIPRILYHWRCHADSTAENTASKSYAYEAGRAALGDFCKRRGWQVRIAHSLHLGFYDIDYVPELLAVRSNVGIVGGRILDGQGRICGGGMDQDGRCLYEGLHREYSGGSTHRAALKQDVAAADIRCMQVGPGLQEEFAHITGLPYRERVIHCRERGSGRDSEMRIADLSGLSCDEAGYRKLSMELSRAARKRGYLVVWNPELTIRI